MPGNGTKMTTAAAMARLSATATGSSLTSAGVGTDFRKGGLGTMALRILVNTIGPKPARTADRFGPLKVGSIGSPDGNGQVDGCQRLCRPKYKSPHNGEGASSVA